MGYFLLGFLWDFLVVMRLRIVAYTERNFLNAGWTFLVSGAWLLLIRHVVTNVPSVVDILCYAAGTAVGSVVATMLHSRFTRKKISMEVQISKEHAPKEQ